MEQDGVSNPLFLSTKPLHYILTLYFIQQLPRNDFMAAHMGKIQSRPSGPAHARLSSEGGGF